VTDYLARSVGRPSFFLRVAKRVDRAGRALLPEMLPLGLGHGDYAMRNVLVGPTGAVRVIDANGRWYTPIYEDIGCLLIDVKCNRIQVLSRGRMLKRRIRTYEEAFLEGYFGRKLDGEAELVGLYQVQACLDKWASRVAHHERTRRLAPRVVGALRLGFASSYFRKVIEACLHDLPG
jgi:aminoglycoside phosphotransferase (APT) family kinase protein